MDRISEEEMKSLGFFGIFKQSFKTIFTYSKIFFQITLTLILPLTLLYIGQMQLAVLLFKKVESFDVLQVDDSTNYQDEVQSIIKVWLYYALFTFIFLIFFTIFSVLSTAAVVLTIASINYTDREIVFGNVMKIVPKILKRLLVTLIYINLAFFLYDKVVRKVLNTISGSIFQNSIFGLILSLIIQILYTLLFLYLSVVWQLASVVTVLEDCYGFKAMGKGKNLAYGKKKVGMGIAFVLYGFLVGLIYVYGLFVLYGRGKFELAMGWRVVIGIVCGVLLLILFLVFIVMQTVLYLVCKSHHKEPMDKLRLSTLFGGETVVHPAAGEEVQFGRAQAQQV